MSANLTKGCVLVRSYCLARSFVGVQVQLPRSIHSYQCILDAKTVWWQSGSLARPSSLTATTFRRECSSAARQHMDSLSSDEEKRMKVLKLEYDVFLSSGIRVPDHVSDEDWLKLLYELKTISARKRYYTYLYKTEKRQLARQAKREKNAILREANEARPDREASLHGFKNTFNLRIQENTMNKWYHNNLYYALMNGPQLVFDFSFESRMTEQELNSLIFQLQLCHHANKTSREPFHFHFCNALPNCKILQKLEMTLLLDVAKAPLTVTDQHYTECFPKSRLVYLSPNAPTPMTTFDADDVYVIGGIVDKAEELPLTLARAKQEKLRTVRLPIDEHIKWVTGSKSLTLNTVVGILLDFRRTGDWTQSLVNNISPYNYDTSLIPKRKPYSRRSLNDVDV